MTAWDLIERYTDSGFAHIEIARARIEHARTQAQGPLFAMAEKSERPPL